MFLQGNTVHNMCMYIGLHLYSVHILTMDLQLPMGGWTLLLLH